jgi:hypothetical protein
LKRRIQNKELTEEEAKNVKIKAKIMYTYETVDKSEQKPESKR